MIILINTGKALDKTQHPIKVQGTTSQNTKNRKEFTQPAKGHHLVCGESPRTGLWTGEPVPVVAPQCAGSARDNSSGRRAGPDLRRAGQPSPHPTHTGARTRITKRPGDAGKCLQVEPREFIKQSENLQDEKEALIAWISPKLKTSRLRTLR